MNGRHFRRGGRGVFKCTCCGRPTRQTDAQALGAESCPECWDLGGMDNAVNDEGREPTERELAQGKALLEQITAKGGDADQAAASCGYLFPVEPEQTGAGA